MKKRGHRPRVSPGETTKIYRIRLGESLFKTLHKIGAKMVRKNLELAKDCFHCKQREIKDKTPKECDECILHMNFEPFCEKCYNNFQCTCTCEEK